MRDLPRRYRRNSSVTDNATIFSITKSVSVEMDKELIEEKLQHMFLTIGPRIMTQGIVVGHFKGAVRCGNAVYSLSVTREDVLDETTNPEWDALEMLKGFTITINLLSILPCNMTKEELEAALDQLLETGGNLK